MRSFAVFPVVAASLVGLATLPERAYAQSNPYALDRLFLDPSDRTPLYEVLSFTNKTGVANYYGVTSDEACLQLDFLPATVALPPPCCLRDIRICRDERVKP
jgi:hypothetical protein